MITTPMAVFNSTTTEPFSDIEIQCNQYYQNSTVFITSDYGGIPENLIINLSAWFGLLVVFTFLRRVGDYGRFGLVKSSEERHLLPKKVNRYKISENRRYPTNAFKRWTSKFFGQKNDGFVTLSDNEQTAVSNGLENITATQSTVDNNHSEEYKDMHLFSWLIHMFKLKDQHIKEKSGEDAIYYLVFQRYLIVYIFVIMLVSLIIILPLNIFSGSDKINTSLFMTTTITNIKAGSSVLWVHLFCSWVFLFGGFVVVRLFSKRMSYTEGDYVSRTILITNYPENHCKIDVIYQHFSEAYPELVIKDIQFAYDVDKLNKLESERCKMKIGRIASENIFQQTGQRPLMYSFHCGSCFEIFCCGCNRCMKEKNRKIIDSIDFYTKHEKDYAEKMYNYKKTVLENPLGIIFITFENKSMAELFFKDYKLGFSAALFRSCLVEKNRCTTCYLCKSIARKSTLSDEIKSDRWQVKYATSPDNIKWENISKYSNSWWIRLFLLNFLLFIVMIFFTTPAIILDKLRDWGSMIDYKEFEKLLPNALAEFLPSLILRLLAALLPVLVALTALAELHWTRSAENRSTMTKTFLLLLFMVLFLPTLGLNSIDAAFRWFKDNSNVKWKCVSDNGAFFIKYVTTCSLIGTALDLLRLPDLFLYSVRMLWSRSLAERLYVKMKVAFEFDYGVQYAWMITIFTVTLSFSIVCPLITPFGLIYLIFKHLVDRFNIYFGYLPTKVDKRIHKTAITFTIAGFIVLQFFVFLFIAVLNKNNINTNAMFTIQIVIIALACALFFGRIFFGFFKRFSPFDSAPIIETPKIENATPTNENNAYISNEIDSLDENDQNQIVAEEHDSEDATNKISTQLDAITQQPAALNQKRKNFKQIRSKFFPSTKNKRNIPTNNELQSPFIPSLLRSISIDKYKNQNSMVVTESNSGNQISSNEESRSETPKSTLNLSKINLDLTDELDTMPSRLSYGTVENENSLTENKIKKTGLQNDAFQ